MLSSKHVYLNWTCIGYLDKYRNILDSKHSVLNIREKALSHDKTDTTYNLRSKIVSETLLSSTNIVKPVRYPASENVHHAKEYSIDSV